MSFDLGVWYSSKAITNEEACEIYRSLCTGDASVVEQHESTRAFFEELTTRYPDLDKLDLDNLTDDQQEDNPWTCGFGPFDGYLIMNIRWDRAEDISEFVEELAEKHGLVCYNPQDDAVSFPSWLVPDYEPPDED